MANMTHCRFQNTLADLRDCYENIESHELSVEEERARVALVTLCKQIAEERGNEVKA
ncbi:MAG: hypothetical protein KGI92_10795 [Alphaproteobacteria bacterium]|nr:hypothetical protein [Alphaproteobacteria bacterium]